MARSVSLGLVLSLLLASCTKTSGGQTGDEDSLPSGDELYGDFGKRDGSADYEPARSIAELAAGSERIVVGHAVALRAGRTFDASFGARLYTVVLELEVEQTLKGSSDSSLYLEFLIGAEDASPPRRLPDARVVVFAARAGLGDSLPVEGVGRGLPAGETLYRPTTPQGFAAESENGNFSQPLEFGDRALGSGDFADLILRVEAALALEEAETGIEDAGQGPRDGGASADASAADAASCMGELASPSPASPSMSVCPKQCSEVRASPWDSTTACIDYGSAMVIGCLQGAGPPVVVCVERNADGQRFQIGSGWPFPDSTAYKLCSEDVTTTVSGAPSCP